MSVKIGNFSFRRIIIAVLLICIFSTLNLYSQELHQYPRSGVLSYGGGQADWYARFDYVTLGWYISPSFVYEIKNINPKTVVIQTVDYNVAAHLGNSLPSDYRLKMHDGDTWSFYFGGIRNPAPDQMAPNFSDVCPLINGKQCWEWFAEYVVSKTDLVAYDGLASDGSYNGTFMAARCPPDIDLDCNGVKDLDEHGLSWVVSHWQAGTKKLVNKIRDLIGPDKIFITNTGMPFYGHADVSALSGAMLELWGYEYDFNWFLNNAWKSFYEKVRTPHFSLDQCNPTYGDPLRTKPLKNYYSFIRWTLTKCNLGGIYHSYQDKYSPDDYWNRYYDEYDLELGFETSGIQRVGGDEIYVIFLEGGVSICNVTGHTVTVTDADLQPLDGYDGPYYRFQGGQDPQFNNGELFDSVNLVGAVFGETINTYVGDGIILVKTPTFAISDIIIDGCDPNTSPGSAPTVFNGDWQEVFEENDNFYIRIAAWIDETLSGYHVTSAGGNETAVLTPTIGHPGYYKVLEWHGYHRGNEATNVRYTINHAGGSLDRIVNQQENHKRWNDLGTYFFNVGTSGNVTISSIGANGDVIADAVSFVFQEPGSVDEIPPNSPQSLNVETATENSIHLSWNAPQQASDGDIATAYQIYRDGILINGSNSTSYLDVGLSESSTYNYEVYSTDKFGNLSVSPAALTAATTADYNPPVLVSAEPKGLNTLIVTYNEAVETSSAENRNNYEIGGGVSVLSASQQNTLSVVELSTSGHTIGLPYTLLVSNVRDRAVSPNAIIPNSSINYTGESGMISVQIAADDNYELYINGNQVGTGSSWAVSQNYKAAAVAGKNVIAVKCVDTQGLAGLVAEIDFNDEHFVSDDSWKISTALLNGWEEIEFDDQMWQKASSLGDHGVATPWADYNDVSGISTEDGVQWIWSADNENDDAVYFRFTIRTLGDMEPPAAPTGLRTK